VPILTCSTTLYHGLMSQHIQFMLIEALILHVSALLRLMNWCDQPMNQIITLADFTPDKKCLGYCLHPYFFFFFSWAPSGV